MASYSRLPGEGDSDPEEGMELDELQPGASYPPYIPVEMEDIDDQAPATVDQTTSLLEQHVPNLPTAPSDESPDTQQSTLGDTVGDLVLKLRMTRATSNWVRALVLIGVFTAFGAFFFRDLMLSWTRKSAPTNFLYPQLVQCEAATNYSTGLSLSNEVRNPEYQIPIKAYLSQNSEKNPCLHPIDSKE